MSDKIEGAESGPAAAGGNPAAVALGLAGASRAEADSFLREQRQMLHLQMEEMRQRNPYEISHFRLRRFSGWAKALFELSIGLLVLVLVAGISLMVWNAAHSDGLVIESFTVPPDMAARGMNGQVIAGQVLDRVTVMNAVRSNRAAQSYANNWGDDLKVEIPDTGMSVGELYRFLKNWLGRETHVTGEVWRTENGIAITARVTGGSGATVTGPAADLPALLQRAAESIFAQTQPYRYAVYLTRNDRRPEALPRYKYLALNGAASDRGWAYLGWGNAIADSTPVQEVERLLRQSLPYPVAGTTTNLAVAELDLGRHELYLTYLRRADELARGGSDGQNPIFAAGLLKSADARLSAALGAYHDAAASMQAALSLGYTSINSASYLLAALQMGAHDLAGARAAVVNPVPSGGFFGGVSGLLQRPNFDLDMAWALEDWARVVSRAQLVATIAAKTPGTASRLPTTLHPRLAYAQAKLGDIAAAEALIAPTPADCYPCLRQRARIAEVRGQRARADWWFSRAAAIGPSLPFAHTEWGEALLARGKPDAAIEKFKLAKQKGSHFADPLEGWGEALMAKNQSHLALAKFKEAEKYAPNWGRLHLKWGEALAYAGKPDEAKAQFARATALDLTKADRAQLSRVAP
ncbi:MAG: hypothetical protein H0U98_18545 [Alphaproteobacteria bacterium]|nr:hypothetical protein [Alphaproteobacteria bacterium]